MKTTENYDVLAGAIIAAHGVQGGVKIRLATLTALPLISAGAGITRKPVEVWVGTASHDHAESQDEIGKFATITQLKEMQAGGNVYLAKILGVRDRNAAELLIGKSIYGPESRRLPLADDEFFVNDLIGLTVVGNNGQEYGKIVTVHQHPANDVYETDQGAMIPAVKDAVISVDLAQRLVTVNEILGLRPDEAEEVRAENEVGAEHVRA